MVAQSAKIEAGHVHLPREVNWLDTFLLEAFGIAPRSSDNLSFRGTFGLWSSNHLDIVIALDHGVRPAEVSEIITTCGISDV